MESKTCQILELNKSWMDEYNIYLKIEYFLMSINVHLQYVLISLLIVPGIYLCICLPICLFII